MAILVTGGAGFIGSHTGVELLKRGQDVLIIDDYSNSSTAAVEAIRSVSGKPASGALLVALHIDLRDLTSLDRVFEDHQIESVIHFAGKKSVRESGRLPLQYYSINVGGTVNLLQTMIKYGVAKLVFSSSCSIYGGQYSTPIAETAETRPTNPYARSKLTCEQILADACDQHRELSIIALRYFNPIGAHPTGSLGEDPRGIPSNVLPYIMQVAVGRLPVFEVYGDDYDTADGTGVRDYIHVMDVAEAHCVALERLDERNGIRAFNIGTGTGVSVLELLANFESVTGQKIPYKIVARQQGDVATLIADPGRIQRDWGWSTSRDLQVMCRDAWRFQRLHPEGYISDSHNVQYSRAN